MTEEGKKNTLRKWKLLLTVITSVAFILVVIFSRHQIVSTLKNLKTVNLWVISLLIPIEIANYIAQAKMYEESLKTLGHKLSAKFLFKFSLELNFISTIFPSGGLSGISYTGLRLRSKGVSAAQATLIQLIKMVIVFFSFLVLLVVGLLALAIGGRVNEFMILIAGSLVTLLLVLTFAAIFIIGSKKRIEGVFTYLTRQLNRLIKIFRPRVSETINVEKVRVVFTELHESYMLFRHNLGALKWPFFWGIIANITEVAALYVVYIAFGHWVNPGGVIMAYAVANFAGFVSVLPGGVGVYETLMTLILAGAGVRPALSLPVTVTYRIVNTLIQIIPGYILYQKGLRSHEIKEANG